MSDLDKPRSIRHLPPEGGDAIQEIIRRLGPLTRKELGYGLRGISWAKPLKGLLKEGLVVVLEEEPVIVYGLPEHKKYRIDNGIIE